MKLIHCADLHLDSAMEANLTKEQAKLRRKELLMTFGNMVDYAQDQGVRAILIAGDLFDKARITVSTREFVLDRIRTHSTIDFYYIRGNHDMAWLQTLEEEHTLPDNLYLFGEDWKTYVYENEQITITGAQLNENNQNRLYQTLMPEPSMTNIVMLHGQEADYVGKDQTQIIRLKELRGRSIDYLALGHIHTYKAEILDQRGIYCYSGCLEGRGFDECGEKGFVLLEIENHQVKSQFIPAAQRRLYEISVDLTGILTSSGIEHAVAEALRQIPQESMVKVILEGVVELDTPKDIEYLSSRFKGDFFFFKIYDRTRLEIHIEDYQNDVSLKGEFIRLVLSESMPQEKKMQVIMSGIRALNGEEII